MMLDRSNWPTTGHFSADELACQCGCGQLYIDPYLLRTLETLRGLAGAPVIILSGYRCPAHNRAVGGANQSRHLLGCAADIVVRGLSVAAMADLAERVNGFRDGGIGLYPEQGFIHVDLRAVRTRWTHGG